MISYLPSKSLIFYTLEVEDYTENLRDFLEDKICRILGLNRILEYELLFNNALGPKQYSCILIPKEEIQNALTKSTQILSHPIFFAQEYIKEKGIFDFAFFLLCESENCSFVGFLKGEIIFFEVILESEILEKIAQIKEDFSKDIRLFFYGKKDFLQNLALKNLEILEKFPAFPSQNFAPQRAKIPQRFYYGLIASFLGIFFGFFYVFYVFFLEQKIQNENRAILAQITALENKNLSKITLQKERKKKEVILEQKQKDLQAKIKKNKAILKEQNTALFAFKDLVESLNQKQLKLAFLDFDEKKMELLLLGNHKGSENKFFINSYRKIGEFDYLEITNF